MTKLSQRSEVSYHIVQDIFRDPFRVTTTETINRLARVLGVKAIELLEEAEEEVTS